MAHALALGSVRPRALGFIGLRPAEPTYPQLTGRVVDDADLFERCRYCRARRRPQGARGQELDQVVVVTLPSLQGFTIEDFGYQLGRHWGIGTKEKDNGVLLIVAPNERKVRIEVGRGLEPLLTDAMSNVIINGAILPRFRSGDYAGGIKEGVKGIELRAHRRCRRACRARQGTPRCRRSEDRLAGGTLLDDHHRLVHLGDLAEHAAPGLWAKRRTRVHPRPGLEWRLRRRRWSGGSGGGGFSGGGEASAAAAPPAAGRYM